MDRYLSILIPPLVLLTLTENAIKHGIEPKLEGGEISLSAEKVDHQIFQFAIANPICRESYVVPGTSTGLSNTEKRLNLLHPDIHGLKVLKTDSEFKVTFKIRSAQ